MTWLLRLSSTRAQKSNKVGDVSNLNKKAPIKSILVLVTKAILVTRSIIRQQIQWCKVLRAAVINTVWHESCQIVSPTNPINLSLTREAVLYLQLAEKIAIIIICCWIKMNTHSRISCKWNLWIQKYHRPVTNNNKFQRSSYSINSRKKLAKSTIMSQLIQEGHLRSSKSTIM